MTFPGTFSFQVNLGFRITFAIGLWKGTGKSQRATDSLEHPGSMWLKIIELHGHLSWVFLIVLTFPAKI